MKKLQEIMEVIVFLTTVMSRVIKQERKMDLVVLEHKMLVVKD